MNKNPATFNSRMFYLRGVAVIIALLLSLSLFTIFAENNNWDRRLTSLFYTAGKGWPQGQENPWIWLYNYGPIPGVLFSLLVLGVWYFRRNHQSWQQFRPYLLIWGLTPIIAGGFLVNVLLKDHTGRPRPRQTIEFGGKWDYKPVFKVGIPGKGHAFPCGHCSIGFVFTSGIIFWNRSRKIALSSLFLGLGYGFLMSATRIIQGGHFLSDAVWALGVVLLTISVLYYFVFQPPRTESLPTKPFNRKQKWQLFSGIALLITFLALFSNYRRPFYDSHSKVFKIPKEVKAVDFNIPETWTLLPLVYNNSENADFLLEINGFAPHETLSYMRFKTTVENEKMSFNFTETFRGFHTGIKSTLKVQLPNRFKAN